MIDIAVIGTGIIAAEHLEAIKKLDEVRLTAVCDKDEKKARAAAEKYNTRYFTDYRDIVGKADAVILNLPHFLHCEVSVFFLEAGLDVLVEKPMANTVAECDRMIDAAEKSGRKLAVGHVQRYFKANRELKRIIESGEYGPLCMMSERRTTDYFSASRPEWFLNKATAGGGIIMNYGAHALDKLLYLTGDKITSVTGSVGNFANSRDIDGHAQFFATVSGGACADITLCGYNFSTYDNMYYFPGATIRVNETTELSIFSDGVETKIPCEEDGGFMLRQLEEFCKYIKGEPSEITDGEYGRQIIQAIEVVCNGK